MLMYPAGNRIVRERWQAYVNHRHIAQTRAPAKSHINTKLEHRRPPARNHMGLERTLTIRRQNRFLVEQMMKQRNRKPFTFSAPSKYSYTPSTVPQRNMRAATIERQNNVLAQRIEKATPKIDCHFQPPSFMDKRSKSDGSSGRLGPFIPRTLPTETRVYHETPPQFRHIQSKIDSGIPKRPASPPLTPKSKPQIQVDRGQSFASQSRLNPKVSPRCLEHKSVTILVHYVESDPLDPLATYSNSPATALSGSTTSPEPSPLSYSEDDEHPRQKPRHFTFKSNANVEPYRRKLHRSTTRTTSVAALPSHRKIPSCDGNASPALDPSKLKGVSERSNRPQLKSTRSHDATDEKKLSRADSQTSPQLPIREARRASQVFPVYEPSKPRAAREILMELKHRSRSPQQQSQRKTSQSQPPVSHRILDPPALRPDTYHSSQTSKPSPRFTSIPSPLTELREFQLRLAAKEEIQREITASKVSQAQAGIVWIPNEPYHEATRRPSASSSTGTSSPHSKDDELLYTHQRVVHKYLSLDELEHEARPSQEPHNKQQQQHPRHTSIVQLIETDEPQLFYTTPEDEDEAELKPMGDIVKSQETVENSTNSRQLDVSTLRPPSPQEASRPEPLGHKLPSQPGVANEPLNDGLDDFVASLATTSPSHTPCQPPHASTAVPSSLPMASTTNQNVLRRGSATTAPASTLHGADSSGRSLFGLYRTERRALFGRRAAVPSNTSANAQLTSNLTGVPLSVSSPSGCGSLGLEPQPGYGPSYSPAIAIPVAQPSGSAIVIPVPIQTVQIVPNPYYIPL